MDDFGKIWLPLADRFYRVAYHLLESQADAEDVVQELYLKLLSIHGKVSFVRDPAAYGITLLRNMCIDRIRRREARRTEQLQEYMPDELSGPEKEAIERDALIRIVEEIGRLPEKQAQVMKLKVLEGLEYDEISQRTGLSLVHVRVLISMARKTLRKKMNL